MRQTTTGVRSWEIGIGGLIFPAPEPPIPNSRSALPSQSEPSTGLLRNALLNWVRSSPYFWSF